MEGRFIVFVTALVLLVSCGLREIGEAAAVEGGIWTGPGSVVVDNESGQEGERKICYTVGVDYPDGYDWRADEEKGSVRCSLVVYADGIPLMKVPVGDEYEISSDPDTHRIIEGCLYTDYSSDSETVIKRNGETLFRYSGREMIIGMAMVDDEIYTLGQARDGEGFAFRINGDVVFEHQKGYLFPHLQMCEDCFSFAFYEPVEFEGTVQHRYYHYLGGEVCQIRVQQGVETVWDVIFHDNEVCYVASMFGMTVPVLVTGDLVSPMGVKGMAEMISCRFVPSDDGLNVEGVMSQSGKELFSCLWSGAQLHEVFQSGYTAASVYAYADHIACVLNGQGMFVKGFIYCDGSSWEIPEGYMSIGGPVMVMIDGKLHVGLTSQEGEYAVIWTEEKIKPLKINGFISHMSAG